MKDGKGKTALKLCFASLGLGAAAFVGAGAAMYEFVLSRRGLNSRIATSVVRADEKKKEADKYLYSLEKIIFAGADWYNETEKEQLTTENDEGTTLHAALLRPEKKSDVYVVCIHGYNSSPANMGVYAKKFLELGYNVLMPSLRGHADSEDEFISMGWKDRLDVLKWLEFLASAYPECKIILHGVSMGAATVMMVTGEKMPENVRLAVEDCGYTTVWDIFTHKMEKDMKIPAFPFLYSADNINRLKEKFSFKQASCVEQVKKSVTPTLFIHGEEDKFVPYEMLDKVYEAAACEKEKLSVPDAPHARSVCAHPDMYWKAVTEFIDKYL